MVNISNMKSIHQILKCTNCFKEISLCPSDYRWRTRKGVKNNFCSNSCATSYRNKINNPSKNKETRRKISEFAKTRIADQNPNWRGGKSPFYAYQYLRKDICEICGSIKGKLNAHHIDHNRSNNISDNLITVCDPCHKAQHKEIYRKERNNYGRFI